MGQPADGDGESDEPETLGSLTLALLEQVAAKDKVDLAPLITPLVVGSSLRASSIEAPVKP